MSYSINPFFFKTKKNWYCYDDSTRLTIPISDYEKEFLEELKNTKNFSKKYDEKYNDILDKIKKYHLFNRNNNNIKLITYEEITKKSITEGTTSLILILTEACNFRCRYCWYSDNYYYTNTYTSNGMEFNVAKKGIDLYMKKNIESIKYNPNLRISINFYGGEPLLKWDLIKQIINYIKEKYLKIFKQIYYPITTNGYLLDEEKIKFMFENNFIISVSLDGYEENHNRNRVDINGNPTYNTILNNIKNMEDIYTEIRKNNKDIIPFNILITYDNITDMVKLEDFFSKNPYLDNKIMRINKVVDLNTNYYINQKNEELILKKAEDIDYLFKKYVRGLESKTNSKFLSLYFSEGFLNFEHKANYNCNYLQGCCMPGCTKIALDYKGNWLICEKVSSDYILGNINDDNPNYEKHINYINEFINIVNQKCHNCNVRNLCNLCFANIQYKNGRLKIPSGYCDSFKKSLKIQMSRYYTIKEKNLNIF